MSGSSLRGFGALCLVLCGWCVGDSICVRISEHQRALQRIIELLDRIRREIEFRRADLASLFVRLQREGLVGQAAGSLQELEPFPQLSRREKAAFQNCMAGLGRAEAQQECQRLALYITQFEAFRDDLTPRTTSRTSVAASTRSVRVFCIMCFHFLFSFYGAVCASQNAAASLIQPSASVPSPMPTPCWAQR